LTHTCLELEFEPTTPKFERPKVIRAQDRAAITITNYSIISKFLISVYEEKEATQHWAIPSRIRHDLRCPYALTENDMKAYWGSGGIAPRIFYLGTRWGECQLYSKGKSPW